MDITDQIEQKLEALLAKKQRLEDENRRLKAEVIKERGARREILSRVERLLKKVQEAQGR